MKNKYLKAFSVMTLAFSAFSAHAAVVIMGTRVIYPSDAKDVTLDINNNSAQPSLIQAWIDEGDLNSQPNQVQVPFVITPPITRIDPDKSQSLRIMALPDVKKNPNDRETIYWLNVLDIPPKPSASNAVNGEVPENYLQIAVKSRIKLFYRPSNLKDSASKAPEKIVWQVKNNQLYVNNPTAYYMSIPSILEKKAEGSKELLTENGLLLKPFSEQVITIPVHANSSLSFISINDYGGREEHQINLK